MVDSPGFDSSIWSDGIRDAPSSPNAAPGDIAHSRALDKTTPAAGRDGTLGVCVLPGPSMSDPFVVNFDPVAVSLGPIQVHWYGLMYLGGFLGAWALGEYRRRQGRLPVNADALRRSHVLLHDGRGAWRPDRLHALLLGNLTRSCVPIH